MLRKWLDISLNKLFFFKEKCKGVRETRTKRRDEKKNQWEKKMVKIDIIEPLGFVDLLVDFVASL